jgi:hypothetical protein
LLEIIGLDENAEDEEDHSDDEEAAHQIMINKQQRKLKRLMEMTKAEWQVMVLKLQRRRPAHT